MEERRKQLIADGVIKAEDFEEEDGDKKVKHSTKIKTIKNKGPKKHIENVDQIGESNDEY